MPDLLLKARSRCWARQIRRFLPPFLKAQTVSAYGLLMYPPAPTIIRTNFRALSRFPSSSIPETRHSRAPILAPGLSAASHGPHNHKQRGCLLVPLLYRFSHDHELDQAACLGPAVVPLALSLLLPPCLQPPLLRNTSCSTTEREPGSSSHRNPHPRRFSSSLPSARQIRPVLTHRFLSSATPHHPTARMAQPTAIPSSGENVVPYGIYGGFLNHLATKESSVVHRPAPLSVKQHAANEWMRAGVRFIQPRFADTTETNICGIYGKWKQYASLPLCQVID